MFYSEWIIPKYGEDKCIIFQIWTSPTWLSSNCFIKLKKLYKFWGLGLDRLIKWNNRMELIIPKMSSACYTIRSIYFFSDKTTLKIIYLAYFHSIMEYVIIFCGKSSDSRKVFQLQKKILWIMTWSQSRDSYKSLFQTL